MSKDKKQHDNDDYIPFGPEWENELMKLPKKAIINMFRTKCIEIQNLRNEQEENNRDKSSSL